jgi:hypothetical protein
MRDFYNSSRRKKESRHRRYLKDRAWDILTSEERRVLANDDQERGKPKARMIMCIGQAGTGVLRFSLILISSVIYASFMCT